MPGAAAFLDYVATLAESYVGVCACPGPGREAWERLLAPYAPEHGWDWRAFRVSPPRGMSTCGLFAEAILDRAGVAVPWHGQRYRFGTAISRLITWARAERCWQPYADGLVPPRGAVLVCGAGLRTHELVVTGCDGVELASVDAGQVCDRGLQAIRLRTRSWGGGLIGDRRVLGWCDPGVGPVR
jgi:hypothetical protein